MISNLRKLLILFLATFTLFILKILISSSIFTYNSEFHEFVNVSLSGNLELLNEEKECGTLIGNETGFWRRYGAADFRFHLDKCKLRRFTPSEARSCLSNNSPLVFVGQSVMRYQYLWLRQFVEENPRNNILHEVCESRVLSDLITKEGRHEDEKEMASTALLKMGGEAKRWLHFFKNSSTSSEICDCGRPDGFKNPFVENRFYFHSDNLFKILFYWVIGDRLSFGHVGLETNQMNKLSLIAQLYNKCCETCGKFCSKGNCKFQKKPGNCFIPLEGRASLKLYKNSNTINKGKRQTKSSYWSKTIDELINDITNVYRPKVLLFGTLYSWLECDSVSSKKKLAIMKNVKIISPHTRALYRTCPTVKSKEKNEPVNHDDSCFRTAAKISGWSVLDVNYMTKKLWEYNEHVAREAYYDHIHFKCYIYREMNNLLLNRICNT